MLWGLVLHTVINSAFIIQLRSKNILPLLANVNLTLDVIFAKKKGYSIKIVPFEAIKY